MFNIIKNSLTIKNYKCAFLIMCFCVFYSLPTYAQKAKTDDLAGIISYIDKMEAEELTTFQKNKVDIINSDTYRLVESKLPNKLETGFTGLANMAEATVGSLTTDTFYDDDKKEIQKEYTKKAYETENKIDKLVKSGEITSQQANELKSIYKEQYRIEALIENSDPDDFTSFWNARDTEDGSFIEAAVNGAIDWTKSVTSKSDIVKWREELSRALEDAKGTIPDSELKLIQDKVDIAINKKFAELKEQAAKEKDEELISQLQRSQTESNESIISIGCPTIEEMEMKYASDCYSCLVVKSLLTAFLGAASKVYSTSQEAGLKLLAFGSVLWILTYFLKKLASFTSLEPMAIMSDITKFGFKILLAYVFITAGIRTAMQYTVEPFLGFGAIIAQELWPTEIKEQTEDYIWEDYNYADIDKKYEEAKVKQKEDVIVKPTETKTKTITPDDMKAKEDLAKAQNKKEQTKLSVDGKNVRIPSFKIPGASGTFTSPFGCRPAPRTKGGKGSSIHKGVDISSSAGTTVYAIGSGSVTYSNSGSGGYTAHVNHGSGWTSIYHHMQSRSMNFATSVNKKLNLGNPNKVAQGQQIGFMGNTGNSGGVHLHLSVKYNGKFVDPLSLTKRKIVYPPSSCPNPTTAANRTPPPEGFVRDRTKVPEDGWSVDGMATEDLSSTFSNTSTNSGFVTGFSGPRESLGKITYDGPTDILSKSVINSILGATQVITNNMSKIMMVGNVITCFAEEENGGAWKLSPGWFFSDIYMTNIWLWFCGAIIWILGFLLTLSVTYYLLDMSFKIGFAVMALPIVVGLWPFNITKGRLKSCIGIILTASATFAFLAITTGFALELIYAAFGPDGKDGFLVAIRTNDSEYVSRIFRLDSQYFYLLLFCLIYSYKLIGQTVKTLAAKFFSDPMFGQSSPMHSMSTMATKIVVDKALAPVAKAKDIAVHQTGRLANASVKNTGKAVENTGKAVENTGKAIKKGGEMVDKAGQAISKAGSSLHSIPVVGSIAAVAIGAVGVTVQAAGKATKLAGQATEAAGKGTKAVGKLGKNVQAVAEKTKETVKPRQNTK